MWAAADGTSIDCWRSVRPSMGKTPLWMPSANVLLYWAPHARYSSMCLYVPHKPSNPFTMHNSYPIPMNSWESRTHYHPYAWKFLPFSWNCLTMFCERWLDVGDALSFVDLFGPCIRPGLPAKATLVDFISSHEVFRSRKGGGIYDVGGFSKNKLSVETQ